MVGTWYSLTYLLIDCPGCVMGALLAVRLSQTSIVHTICGFSLGHVKWGLNDQPSLPTRCVCLDSSCFVYLSLLSSRTNHLQSLLWKDRGWGKTKYVLWQRLKETKSWGYIRSRSISDVYRCDKWLPTAQSTTSFFPGFITDRGLRVKDWGDPKVGGSLICFWRFPTRGLTQRGSGRTSPDR